MPKIEIKSESPLTLVQVKEELEMLKKRDKELNFRAAKTEEHLNQFKILKAKKSAELYSKIEKLNIPRLKDIHVCKIVDLLPTTIGELKSVLQGYTVTISGENQKKIVNAVKEFV